MNGSDSTQTAGGESPNAAAARVVDALVAVRRVVAHWQLLVLVMVLGALATMAVVRTRHPMFKSETVIVFSEGIGRTVAGSTESQDAVRTLGTKLKELLMAQQTL